MRHALRLLSRQRVKSQGMSRMAPASETLALRVSGCGPQGPLWSAGRSARTLRIAGMTRHARRADYGGASRAGIATCAGRGRAPWPPKPWRRRPRSFDSSLNVRRLVSRITTERRAPVAMDVRARSRRGARAVPWRQLRSSSAPAASRRCASCERRWCSR